MDKKYKIVALFGKSSAGKDYLQKWIVNNYDVNKMISCTTRPPRDYEKHGVDYYFLSNAAFVEKVLNGEILEATEFRNWFYGTPIETLDKDKINIGVFNPSGVSFLLEDPRVEVYPIWIQASDKRRLMRSLNREANPDCAEICRRFATDETDFADIDFEYLVYNNESNDNLPELRKIINNIGQK